MLVVNYILVVIFVVNEISAAPFVHIDKVTFFTEMLHVDKFWIPVLQNKISYPAEEVISETAGKLLKNLGISKDLYGHIEPLLVVDAVVHKYNYASEASEFGMFVVRTAVSCTAMQHLSFQALIVVELIGRGEPNASVYRVAESFSRQVVTYMDQLGVLDDRLKVPSDIYWTLKSLLDKSEDEISTALFPLEAKDNFANNKAVMDAVVENTCTMKTLQHYYSILGVDVDDRILSADDIGQIETDRLRSMLQSSKNKLTAMLTHLPTKTMRIALWNDLIGVPVHNS